MSDDGVCQQDCGRQEEWAEARAEPRVERRTRQREGEEGWGRIAESCDENHGERANAAGGRAG